MLTIHPSHQPEARRTLIALALLALLWLALLALPPFLPRINLPLQIGLETLGIVLAALIFAVVWSAPRTSTSRNASLLAATFLGVALLNFSHLLSHPGMPGFVTPGSVEQAINFWLAAQWLGALGLLVALWLPWQTAESSPRWPVLLGVLALVAALHAWLLWAPHTVPRTYIEGVGPTPFKQALEALLIGLYLLVMLRLLWLWRQPRTFNASGLLGAAAAMAMGVALFAQYAGANELFYLRDHLFKILSYWFLYRAVFVEALLAPQQALQARHIELEQARANLARKQERLQNALDVSRVEIAERKQAQAEREALGQQLGDLAANVPGVLFSYRHEPDGQPRCLYLSQRAEAVCGVARGLLQADLSHLMARLRTRDRVRLLRAMAESEQLRSPLHTTFRLPHPERGLRWIEISAQPHPQPDGGVLWHGYAQDVTRAHTDQEWLRLADKVFEASQSGIFVTDARRRLVKVNPAFTEITGYPPDEVLGRSPKLLGSGQHDAQFFQRMLDTLAQHGRWQGEVWNRRRSGELYAQWLATSCIRNESDEISHYLAVFTDISGLKAHEQQLDHLANHDMLTGLPNRRLLRDRLQQAIAYSQRNGNGLAVAMLDLDGFKPVNDEHGHAVGDKLLAEVALRLREVVRADETVARLGGDEFVLLFRENHGPLPLERVLQTVQEPILIKDLRLRVGASIGVTRLRADNANVAQLLQEADQAMYQAKAAGRNRFVFFDLRATDQPGAGVPEGTGSESGEGVDHGGRGTPNPLAPVPPADPLTPP